MARYRKIDVRMRSDEKFRSLSAPPPNGQDCWIYLLTNRYTTSIPGLYHAFEESLARDLGWSLEGFREAFREVSEKAMAKADWRAGLVSIPNAISYDPPQSPNVIRGWHSTWDELPECELKKEAWRSLKGFTEGMSKAFVEAFREGCRKALANPDQEPEPEQDQEPDSTGTSAGLLLPPGTDLGKAANAEQEKIVDRFVLAALPIFDALNAARKRVIPGAREMRPTYTSLAGICGRLDAGKTAPECLAVIEACEAECRRNSQSAQWFDAVTPWRPANFDKKLAAAGIEIDKHSGFRGPMKHQQETVDETDKF